MATDWTATRNGPKTILLYILHCTTSPIPITLTAVVSLIKKTTLSFVIKFEENSIITHDKHTHKKAVECAYRKAGSITED